MTDKKTNMLAVWLVAAGNGKKGWIETLLHTYIYLLIAIVAEVIATTALKALENLSNMTPLIVVVIGYGTAFFFLFLTLKTMPIGIVYALWSGLGVILVTLSGWLLYEQGLDFAAILGIALIALGVVIINVFSDSIYL